MDYRIIRSRRRTVALYITPEGTLEVRCPLKMDASQIDAFVKSKEKWIQKHMRPPVAPEDKLTPGALAELKTLAAKDLPERVVRLAPRVGVEYNHITIRSQRTRWGSCTGKGNLNFNCLLMLAPPEVRDYVIVHELCHRREMNHSRAFWTLVGTHCTNYRECRKWLKENGSRLIARLPG